MGQEQGDSGSTDNDISFEELPRTTEESKQKDAKAQEIDELKKKADEKRAEESAKGTESETTDNNITGEEEDDGFEFTSLLNVGIMEGLIEKGKAEPITEKERKMLDKLGKAVDDKYFKRMDLIKEPVTRLILADAVFGVYKFRKNLFNWIGTMTKKVQDRFKQKKGKKKEEDN